MNNVNNTQVYLLYIRNMALMLLMYMTSRRARTHSTHTHSHTHACSIPWHYRSCAFTPTNKNAHLFNTMDWHLNSLHTAYVKLAVRVKCTRKTHSRRPNYWVCARPAHTHAAGYALEQFMCLCMMLGVCVCVCPGTARTLWGIIYARICHVWAATARMQRAQNITNCVRASRGTHMKRVCVVGLCV